MKIEKHTVTTEVVDYIAIDGTKFKTMEACQEYEKTLKVTKRKCKKCHGVGLVQGKWIEPFYNYDIGHIEGHYQYDTCPDCNGNGYKQTISKIKQ